MEIRKTRPDEFDQVVREVSDALYDGNVITSSDAHVRGTTYVARLSVRDSHARGARTSWSGRHGPWASWEAHRDVLRAFFERYPDRIIKTAFATYRGLDGFLAEYPATAYKNVGSMMSPATMPDLTV